MTPPPFQLAPAATQPAVAPTLARPTRAGSIASNDLKPASGTIEAKPKHAAQHPPLSSPIEIADQPVAAEDGAATIRGGVPARVPTTRRLRVARKALSDHSVRIYVFVGLAIGAGIVLAYWAYWYLPFGHR
jgi:hypothetical protein